MATIITAGQITVPAPPPGGCSRTAATTGFADVQTAVNAAANGETVCIPAGSATWTTGVSVAKAITLRGAGAGSTVLTDATGAAGRMFFLTESTAGSVHLCDFTVLQGGTQHDPPAGVISMGATVGGKPILISGITFTADTDPGANFIIAETNKGVIYNNTMTSSPKPFGNCLNGSGFVRHKLSGVETDWGVAPHYGADDTAGDQNLYIESNTMDTVMEGVDSDDFSRVVCRFNTMRDSTFATHGADTSTYGSRYMEIYGNLFDFAYHEWANPGGPCAYLGGPPIPANLQSWLSWRGGTAIVHSNSVEAINSQAWNARNAYQFQHQNLRRGSTSYTCYANQGTTLYPAPHQVGWGYSTGATTSGAGAHDCNNIPCGHSANQDLEPMLFVANTGTEPSTAVALNEFSPNNCGVNADTIVNYYVANRDYYVQAGGIQTSATSPFTGASKTGFGTLANRPTTCTTGTVYWATDEGTWRTDVAAPHGKMYTCTAPNTWTAKYGANSTATGGLPYTYPHPLRVP